MVIPNLQGGFVDNCREIVRRMIFHDVNPVMYNWIMIILRPRFDRGCFFSLDKLLLGRECKRFEDRNWFSGFHVFVRDMVCGLVCAWRARVFFVCC